MIPALVPALTVVGFSARADIPPADVAIVEGNQPGYTARACLDSQDRIYSQLRKRYLVDTLGQVMGPPSGSGLLPPPVTFFGTPTSGDLEIVMQIVTPGALGTATFQWSTDGGNAWQPTTLTTAPSVSLPGTGV